MQYLLDPMSRQTCRRLLISIVLLMLWAKLLSPQAVWVAVAALSGACAIISAGFALLHRDPPFGPSLNRWDEAVALVGMHSLARLLI